MLTVNWFDVALILIILWSALTGLRAGLARVVVGFVATIAGLVAGFWFYREASEKLLPWLPSQGLANIFGFLAVFVIVLLLGSIIASLLSRLFNWFGLSWFNHFLGGVAGFIRGAFLIAALVDMIVAFAPSPTPQVLTQSRVLPYASELSSWLMGVAPRELRDAFTEQMNNLRQLWSQPSEQQSPEQQPPQGQPAAKGSQVASAFT